MTETYSLPPDSPRMQLAEEAVELAALSWFELLGWKTVPGDHLAPDGLMGARADYRDAILEPELRSAIASLNPEATATMVEDAIRKIKASPSQDLIENNRLFHPYLVSGVPVEVNKKGETRTIGLRLLDQENPAANRFLVTNQFIVKGDRGTVRTDVTAFINGLAMPSRWRSSIISRSNCATLPNTLSMRRPVGVPVSRFMDRIRSEAPLPSIIARSRMR